MGCGRIGYETATKTGRKTPFILSRQAAVGLYYVQRYRFLTIKQFARITHLKHASASDQLRSLELAGFLGHFGNTGHPGYGKTPKAYFLTRKGWELLRRESGIPEELIGAHKEIHVEARWSPQMYHRLHTVDLLLSAELAVRQRPAFSMIHTFLEYKRIRKGTQIMRETTDFVATPEVAANRIIPDGAFIIENIETKKRALFFVEMDMASERIVSDLLKDHRHTLYHKINQYDRYLQRLRYQKTYAEWGQFSFFTLLFVTVGQTRVENIRQKLATLPEAFSNYYRFADYQMACTDFFAPIWKSRNPGDNRLYALVRET